MHKYESGIRKKSDDTKVIHIQAITRRCHGASRSSQGSATSHGRSGYAFGIAASVRYILRAPNLSEVHGVTARSSESRDEIE